MMMDWKAYRKQLSGRLGELARHSPEMMEAFTRMGQPSANGSWLEPKVREFISLAVAVTTRCDGCTSFHVDKARSLGATKAELAEVLNVAVAMNAGAAMIYSARVIDAFSEGQPEDPAPDR